MPGGRVHWFSILNSLMVVLVMSSIVAMIMMRTIRRDLARYEGLLGDTGQLPGPCVLPVSRSGLKRMAEMFLRGLGGLLSSLCACMHQEGLVACQQQTSAGISS